MRTLTFLHVSDLHFEPTNEFDRAIVIEALLRDLRDRRAEGAQFDAVVFSGDLVQSGDSFVGFEKVVSAFVDPLLSAAGVPRDRFVLCPGNHDISRNAVIDFVEDGLRSSLASVTKINGFIDSALARKSDVATMAALARMDAYESFYAGLSLGKHISDNVFFKTRVLSIDGYEVGFAALNSAWRATGSGGDKNNLIVGERAVDLAIADLASADIRICLVHHPLDWLLESDGNAIENRLFDAFDIICVGHTHRTQPKQYISPLATTVISQSGTTYASRKWFNGYQIIEWNETGRKVRLKCRMYLDNPRRSFVPAEIVAPHGIADFDLKPRANKTQLTDIELFLRQGRSVIREAADEHISFAREEDGKKIDFAEAFVCQPLLPRVESSELIQSSADGRPKQREMTADEILRRKESLALMGGSESGRTSLLHHLSLRVAEGVCDQSRIPAIVSVPLAVKDGYEKALRQYYSNADLKYATLTGAIKDLQWIVFLDDFHSEGKGHVEFVSEISARYPEHRIVMCGDGSSWHAFREAIGRDVVGFDIGFLPRKSIRQLSRVRFSKDLDTGMDDPAYTLVMKHLNESRLPRTGYMVALLLWAAEQEQLGESLNEAVLLENLISFLLGKTNFEAALRNQFDPRAQEFLLRAIAGKLREAGDWLASNELLEFIIEYFRTRGMGHGAREVLDEFIACKLLVERGGHISFRYSCYQEFFIASDLRQNPQKLEELLQSKDTDLLLNSGRILDLWSSLSREMQGSDAAFFKLLTNVGLDRANVTGDLGEVKFTGHQLQLKRSRIAELLENPPTKDQIDEILDRIDKAKSGQFIEGDSDGDDGRSLKHHHIEAQALQERISNLVVQRGALTILTKIIRNSDHEKLATKRETVLAVLRLWSAHTSMLITFLSSMILEAKIEVKFADAKAPTITQEDLNTISNIIKSLGAFGDGSGIAAILTSESLRGPIKDMALDSSEGEGVRFLAALAYSETWDANGIELMRTVLKELNSNVLKHAALQKMLYDYRFQRYRMVSVAQFRNLIAETEGILHGGANAEKSARIAALKELDDGDGQ